ncbi:FAD-binding oxidoreductase [Ruegeria marisrubri]|uniref:FAD-binding oxidoreductase n=1 Tax=Ruegeria marisrubri TaxID=1685379 RepID=A0A0X3TJC5_9RHOB|nr:FAD-dependent oxidoreductase [Ruegeria marisrubri]KUJ73300.1 FAD-binding oxidoreductase [Ruegeria marisrubri]
MTETPRTIAVIGAGIVGVSTAIWLQRDGHRVILIDRKGPAQETSFGNGGILASCSIVPVTVPGLFLKAPRMLFDPNQPLFLKWGYLPKLAPWLAKYLSNASAEGASRAAAALAPIVGDSLQDHLALAQGTGAEKWIAPSDYLFVYNDRAHFQDDAFGWELRRKHGFAWDELEGQAFRDYDPIFAPDLQFAARLKDHGRILDPGQYVKDLVGHFQAGGGQLVRAEAEDIVRDNGRAIAVRAAGQNIACDAVVVAAGVWSGPLMKKLGLNVQLESERGYHIEFWDASVMPKSPVMVAARKIVATPMDGRLRLAGVVEFGGTDAGASDAPLDLMRKSAEAVFPGLKASKVTHWMGHRPAPADSIPVIGELPHIKGVYTGFGHHHIGLTGGPKTGRLLAQLISGKQPNVDLSAYSPARYTKAGH